MAKRKRDKRNVTQVDRNREKSSELVWGKTNYIFMLIGIALVLIGMVLMIGGDMPNPDTFDESEIYSFRRITFAPIVILAGLIIEFFAIFKVNK